MTAPVVVDGVGWAVHRSKAGNLIAVCEALGLTLQAKIWSELMEDIGETLDAIREDLNHGA